MILSKKLLSQFIPGINHLDNYKIEQAFNKIGIEVESIVVLPEINNLHIGKIIDFYKHHQSQQLNICKVKINHEIKTIVCKANNLAKNKYVIVACENAILPNEKIIAKRKIKDIESSAMICAYSELFPNNSFPSQFENEIILFHKKPKLVKNNVLSAVDLDDVLFDISIPTNRNDLNCVYGIALELSSFLKLDFNDVFSLNKVNCKKLTLDIEGVSDYFAVCFSYNNYQNSNWITRSILIKNNLSFCNDITDIIKISEIISALPIIVLKAKNIKKISFAFAKQKTILNLKNYGLLEIDKQHLVLYINDEIAAVPGVGIIEKYYPQNNEDILCLGVKLDNIAIAKTLKSLKALNGINKFWCKSFSCVWIEYALQSLLFLLSPISKQFSVKKAIKIKKQIIKNLDVNYICKILGFKISQNELIKKLTTLNYCFKNGKLIAPVTRNDIENMHDVAEDILKFYNINNLKPQPIKSSYFNFYDNQFTKIDLLAKYLQSLGFYRLKTYNLTSQNINSKFNFFNYQNPINIKNKISNERQQYRLSLLDAFLSVISYNNAFKAQLKPIFEIQDIYYTNNKKTHLAIMVCDNFIYNSINKVNIKNDLFLYKNIVNNIFKNFNLMLDYDLGFDQNWGYKNDALVIKNKKQTIGYITRINLELLKQYKINATYVYYLEVIINDLLSCSNQLIKINVNDQNKIPFIKNLTFELDNNYNLNQLYNVASSISEISNLEIISVFKSDNNKTCYTVEFNLLSNKNTKQAIDDDFKNVIAAFAKKGINLKK